MQLLGDREPVALAEQESYRKIYNTLTIYSWKGMAQGAMREGLYVFQALTYWLQGEGRVGIEGLKRGGSRADRIW